MGKLLGIAIKTQPKGPLQKLSQTVISAERGLLGDCRGRGGKEQVRQVTIISQTSWQAVCRELEANLSWTLRRANLMVAGINLVETVGQLLRINGLILEITDETKPCSRMDESYQGLRKTLESDWRGGVSCRIKHGDGVVIKIGDSVELVNNRSTGL
jgi:MOSC domain-containing protein YiiM